MSDINTDDYVGIFDFNAFGSKVPEGHFARFVVVFIKELLKSYQLENETFPSSKAGRPAYALHKMASLVYYAYSQGFTHASIIADFAENHHFYQYVANGITPDEDTINNFINVWGEFFEYLLTYTGQFAQMIGLTSFENICVDSTFAKSDNNKFNVLHQDDVEILIDYYSSKYVSDDDLNNLRYPAKKFMNRSDMTNKAKIKYLKDILKRFDETGANTIPVHDPESIHIYNKDGNADVGYNIQTAVDTESKMFVSLIVSQNATDHYQFPTIMNKSLKKMGMVPAYSCADAGYNSRRTLEYVDEFGLNALIDNNRSAKIRNGHANENKFHKDNMEHNLEEDYFECYNHEKLYCQETKVKWDDKKQDYEITRKYYNKDACSNCEYKDECCKGKYRIVTVNGGFLAVNMMSKFDDYTNVIAYTKRFSTVEPPNGTLKTFFHINELLTPGVIRSQNRINLCGGSHNLKRLYNQLMELNFVNAENILKIVKLFCGYVNAAMPVFRNKTLPFFEETLMLPYECESCLPESRVTLIDDIAQMTLI